MLLNQDPLLDIHHRQHELTSALISAALNGHTGTCWGDWHLYAYIVFWLALCFCLVYVHKTQCK